MPHQLPRRVLALLPLLLLAACAQAPAENLPTATATAAVQTATETTLPSFADWRQAMRSEAIATGIDAALFDRVFAGVTPDPAVLKADSSQPEFTRPVWEYLDGAVSSSRIGRGRVLLAQHNTMLQRIEQQYGVEAQILVAIWGLESNFGNNIGSHSVIRSLATLAYDGRRQGFWRAQLLAALQILQNGDVPSDRMIGSWAGAMGQTQFMPTTYNQHAVDFDGDGKRDLWNSSADALASAAQLVVQFLGAGSPCGFADEFVLTHETLGRLNHYPAELDEGVDHHGVHQRAGSGLGHQPGYELDIGLSPVHQSVSNWMTYGSPVSARALFSVVRVAMASVLPSRWARSCSAPMAAIRNSVRCSTGIAT